MLVPKKTAHGSIVEKKRNDGTIVKIATQIKIPPSGQSSIVTRLYKSSEGLNNSKVHETICQGSYGMQSWKVNLLAIQWFTNFCHSWWQHKTVPATWMNEWMNEWMNVALHQPAHEQVLHWKIMKLQRGKVQMWRASSRRETWAYKKLSTNVFACHKLQDTRKRAIATSAPLPLRGRDLEP